QAGARRGADPRPYDHRPGQHRGRDLRIEPGRPGPRRPDQPADAAPTDRRLSGAKPDLDTKYELRDTSLEEENPQISQMKSIDPQITQISPIKEPVSISA